MKSLTVSRGAFAILVARPVLPVGGIVFDGLPVVVFFMGAGFTNDVSPRWGF